MTEPTVVREFIMSFFGTADGQGFYFSEFIQTEAKLTRDSMNEILDGLREKHELESCSLLGIYDNGLLNVGASPWDEVKENKDA